MESTKELIELLLDEPFTTKRTALIAADRLNEMDRALRDIDMISDQGGDRATLETAVAIARRALYD